MGVGMGGMGRGMGRERGELCGRGEMGVGEGGRGGGGRDGWTGGGRGGLVVGVGG